MIEYCQIELTGGRVARVSPEDFEYLSSFSSWYMGRDKERIYARTYDPSDKKVKYMHRMVSGAPRGVSVDHINNDQLDNRRENLRLDWTRQNSQNCKIPRTNTSGHKGVSWCKERSMWSAQIKVRGKNIKLGRYASIADAADAYRIAATKYHGDYARVA